jgi:RNA polymerase sigma factor (sigma-70 family)
MSSNINAATNPSTDTIDLSAITTYGELKKALPTTGLIRVPGINQLRRRATLLLRRETGSGSIEIYDNGFFVFEECGRQTVYGVDRCERPETYNNNGCACGGGEAPDFEPYPWEMILEAAGAARLAHNSESREDYQSEISLDAPASENNIAFSVMPEDVVQEKEEEEAARRREMIRKMGNGLEALKPRQREIIMLRYVEKLTFEEIGERMNTSKGTAHTNLERALKKAQKKICGGE